MFDFDASGDVLVLMVFVANLSLCIATEVRKCRRGALLLTRTISTCIGLSISSLKCACECVLSVSSLDDRVSGLSGRLPKRLANNQISVVPSLASAPT